MDPAIVDLTGVEIELRAWRGTVNTFRATFTDADGAPFPLTDYDAVMIVTDRAGGTVQSTETKTPSTHENTAGGTTLFTLGAGLFSALLGQRTYTWKYLIFVRHRTTLAKHVRFHGDLRVLAPSTPV